MLGGYAMIEDEHVGVKLRDMVYGALRAIGDVVRFRVGDTVRVRVCDIVRVCGIVRVIDIVRCVCMIELAMFEGCDTRETSRSEGQLLTFQDMDEINDGQ
jgi:hypothetical protein